MTYKNSPENKIAIKICGLTQLSQAKSIAAMGVNAIGLIGVKTSPRFISRIQREKIFLELSKSNKTLERVLVVADLEDKDFDLIIKAQGCPSIIQLHGNESQERCTYLRSRYTSLKWWKALRIKEKEDLLLIQNYKNSADALLIDAWSPKSTGGTGLRIPIDWLTELKIDSPWWIAGGISAEWVPKILTKAIPYGIDASSKLEISPGIKDLEKVRNLVQIVKNY